MYDFGKNLPIDALKQVDRTPKENRPALISYNRSQPYIPRQALARKELEGFTDSTDGCILNTMSGD